MFLESIYYVFGPYLFKGIFQNIKALEVTKQKWNLVNLAQWK